MNLALCKSTLFLMGDFFFLYNFQLSRQYHSVSKINYTVSDLYFNQINGKLNYLFIILYFLFTLYFLFL